jgi:hypothetical protein
MARERPTASRANSAEISIYRTRVQDAGAEAQAWGLPVRILVVLVKDLARGLEDFGVAQPSVELPIIRRGRAECGVSHVWHAPYARHGHRHERPRHARISPLVRRVILGLCVDVLGPRGIVLEGRDRSNARSVCAEAVDHGPAILAD